MFEQFTDDCRRGVVQSQVLAREMGHGAAQPAHLLLSLATTRGTAADALVNLGASPDVLRDEVATVPPSPQTMHLTQEANDALHRALIEAAIRGHPFVRTGHLLLALLHQPQATRLLGKMGLASEEVRSRVSGRLAVPEPY